jgi:hypothetical protein
MPGKYVTSGAMALIAADTVLSVIAATTVRPRISDLVLSSNSTPNDYSADFQLQRFSADGTGTGVTPTPLDFNDPASLSTSKHTYTVEPTLTAGEVLLRIAHNQRATVRWVAQPGYEFVIPALAGDGIACLCNAVSTQFTEVATIYFEE